jgi:hypothetical protein
LLLAPIKGVEDKEKFLLSLLPLGKKVDVIKEKKIEIAILRPEFRKFVVVDGVSEIVTESVGGQVSKAAIGVFLESVVAYGVEQMGLAETRVRVYV